MAESACYVVYFGSSGRGCHKPDCYAVSYEHNNKAPQRRPKTTEKTWGRSETPKDKLDSRRQERSFSESTPCFQWQDQPTTKAPQLQQPQQITQQAATTPASFTTQQSTPSKQNQSRWPQTHKHTQECRLDDNDTHSLPFPFSPPPRCSETITYPKAEPSSSSFSSSSSLFIIHGLPFSPFFSPLLPFFSFSSLLPLQSSLLLLALASFLHRIHIVARHSRVFLLLSIDRSSLTS